MEQLRITWKERTESYNKVNAKPHSVIDANILSVCVCYI